MYLDSGTLLSHGRYRVIRTLGHGGFGITYLGEQAGTACQVAIKEFYMSDFCERDRTTLHVRLGTSGSRELVERFLQKFLKEANCISALDHEGIVSVIDVFEENGTAYYVMTYLQGASLADRVREGAMCEDSALRYIRQVASALEYIHSRRIMHLDVKPGNILLDENDNAVLIDFGLAKQYDDSGIQTSSTPVGISAGYAPLEQYVKGGVGTFSPASDIYSLGATLYKLVTGSTPPEANKVNDEGLPELPADISAPVRAAIMAAMRPRRKERPQSIAQFLSLLDGALPETAFYASEEVPGTVANSAESVVKRKIPFWLLLIVIAAVAGISVWALSGSAEKSSVASGASGTVTGIAVDATEHAAPAATGGMSESDLLYEKGCTAYSVKDYEKAVSLLEQAALSGNPKAVYKLGNCYINGRGVEKSEEKAVELWLEAAEQDYDEAYYQLGVTSFEDEAYGDAVEWFQKAARKGNAKALYNLGICYSNGYGVEKSDAKASEVWLKAAEMGYADAQFNIAHNYYNSCGVEKSYKEAARWFEASAKQGNADAMFNLGVCYSIGGYGLSKSYIKAFDCFRKAAEQGHADAKFMLALCYYDGEGTAQSYDDAVVLLKELAMDGHAEGQFFLGLCYEHGHGVKQSDIEAGKWYIRARSNGSADAEEALEKLKRKQYGNDASDDILEQIVGSFVN